MIESDSTQELEPKPKSGIAVPLQSALRIAFVQQVIVLFLAGALLDGGVVCQMCLFAAAGYWGGAIVILARRGKSPTKTDLILIRSGFLLVCIISCILTPTIWKWRGV